MGFSWFQPTHSFPVMGDAQHSDSECIIDTSNGDHVDTLIEPYIAIVLFCQVSLMFVLRFQYILYHTAESEKASTISCLQISRLDIKRYTLHMWNI